MPLYKSLNVLNSLRIAKCINFHIYRSIRGLSNAHRYGARSPLAERISFYLPWNFPFTRSRVGQTRMEKVVRCQIPVGERRKKKESILLLYKFKENERKMAQSSLAELYKNWFSAVSILGTRLLGGVAMTARPLGVRASIT